MFNRWLQENYFKYMLAEYNLNHIYQYGVEAIDDSKQVVNPAYRNLANKLKREKEKLGRLEKDLVKNINLDKDDSLDIFKKNIATKATLVQKIEAKKK